MNARNLSLDEIRLQKFPKEDVLGTFEERFEREQRLKSAMALTNADHEPISLFVKLADGEVVEVRSNLIDFEDEFVEVRGGFGIPLRAIVDVGV
jgi:hypothetical protein